MSVQANENKCSGVSVSMLPEIVDAEALSNDLRKLMVRSEGALMNNDARNNVEQLERWVESYRRGLSAAQKISDNGCEMLHKTRDQLRLALEELYRLEDEGGNPASKDQAAQAEELANAIRRIDSLLPSVEQAFHATDTQSLESAN